MLLHSGFADHPHNRFDILVAAPRATLLTRGEQTWVDDGETVVVSAEDPLQLLRQELDRQPFTPQPHDDLPFLGGALGLFGYDWAVALSVSFARAGRYRAGGYGGGDL